VVIVGLDATRAELTWDLREPQQRVHATEAPDYESGCLELVAELARLVAVKLVHVIVRRRGKALGVRPDEQPAARLEPPMHLPKSGQVTAAERHVLQDIQ